MLRMLLSPIGMVRRLIWQSVFLAIGQVWANKFRAVLTALGIIIGVGSVTIVAAGLDGMQGFVLNEFDKFGARKMWVWGDIPEDKEEVMSYSDVKMSVYEARLILQYAPSIESLSPLTYGGWDVGYGKTMAKGARITGIWDTWHDIEDRQVVLGRPFSKADNEEKHQVCLINEQAIEDLKLSIDPTGDYLLVGGRRFLIVGVIETKEASGMFGGGQSRVEVYMPFNTLKMMNPYSGTHFVLETISADASEAAQDEIRFILRNHRNLDPEEADTFDMFVLQSEIENFNKVARVIGMIVGAIVFVSLIVGGVGIMNIMLVSVSERTREIGLRKAVGAKPFVVLLQFLVEAVVLCLFGGAIGLLIGFGIVAGVGLIPNLPINEFEIPQWALWLSVGFSALVGIVFGMFPAIKASMLNPIDALRHE